MGEGTDIVNAGVSLVHLMANHAGVQTVQGGYASGFPIGTDGSGMSGGSPKQLVQVWKQTSDWYDFLSVDFDFTVGISWMWGIQHDGHGQFVDQITATLEVKHLPIDFTVDVQANFASHGNNFGSKDEPLAGMPLTLTTAMNGIFGQAVWFRLEKNVMVRGDGTYDWPT